MANRTIREARATHGTNPQYLVEKIIRTRIYDSRYWKEECFALSAELLVDKAIALRCIGGVHGANSIPTPFLCLVLKMLQIQPETDIIIEFITQDDFKYARALGAFYLRLVCGSLNCYKYLEPLLNEFRKLRIIDRSGQFQFTHMDEYIDCLLRDECSCDIILPRIQKRPIHEANNELKGRVSVLNDDLDNHERESDEEDIFPPPRPRNDPVEPSRTTLCDDQDGRGHSSSPHRGLPCDREREKLRRSHSQETDHERGKERSRKRHRSRSEQRQRRGSPAHRPHHRKNRGERESNRERGRDWNRCERKGKQYRSGRSK
nr:pre-mRNA-splicing factor 38A-like [Procambarus clarkii]